jgi:salicylate hydroxylase
MTLALALAKFGARVVVLERNRSVEDVGAGLQITPNARRVLNRLGLDRAIAGRAFEPEGIDVIPFRAARPLVTLALGGPMAERFGAPYAVMHRADLAAVLHQACKRFANIDLLFGVRAYDVVSHQRGIAVTVDEADGKSRSGRAFAFAGADGVNSPTRTGVLMGAAATYSGFVAWRTTLEQEGLGPLLAPDRTSVLLGPGFHAVCYPLVHRKQLNVVLVARVSAPEAFGPAPPRAPRLGPKAERSAHFAAILRAAGGRWTFWPLSTVEADDWHQGGIGLVGDAAHAMLPFQAQGAAMAIEDAAVLAPLLMTEENAEDAFRQYQALRRPRIAEVRKVTERNGFAFHLDWPMTMARDATLAMGGREGHLKRLGWLYGYDPAPEPVLAPPPRARRDRQLH